MKRNFLLFLLIVISSFQILDAQIVKGTWLVGGSLGASSYKSETRFSDNDTKGTSYNFSPAAGKFIKDNLVVGVELTIGGFKTEHSVNGEHKYLNAGAAFFVRQYFPIANRFYIYGQGSLGGLYVKEKMDGQTSSQEAKGYNIALRLYPGVSYAVKKNLHLEIAFNNLASVNYIHRKVTNESQGLPTYETKQGEFAFASNIFSQSNFAVGVRFFL